MGSKRGQSAEAFGRVQWPRDDEEETNTEHHNLSQQCREDVSEKHQCNPVAEHNRILKTLW